LANLSVFDIRHATLSWQPWAKPQAAVIGIGQQSEGGIHPPEGCPGDLLGRRAFGQMKQAIPAADPDILRIARGIVSRDRPGNRAQS
jgi:hypothetical protein